MLYGDGVALLLKMFRHRFYIDQVTSQPFKNVGKTYLLLEKKQMINLVRRGPVSLIIYKKLYEFFCLSSREK